MQTQSTKKLMKKSKSIIQQVKKTTAYMVPKFHALVIQQKDCHKWDNKVAQETSTSKKQKA